MNKEIKTKNVDPDQAFIEENKQALKKVLKSMDATPELEAILKKVYLEGDTPKEAMGFSDEIMELTYGYAYRNYKSGNYKDAEIIFEHLTQLDPLNPKYFMGWAGTLQMREKNERALAVYQAWSRLDIYSPFPHYYMAAILRKMKNPTVAFLCYDRVVLRCENSDLLTSLKMRSLMNMKKIIQENPEDFEEAALQEVEKKIAKSKKTEEKPSQPKEEEEEEVPLDLPGGKIELAPPK